MFLSNFNATLRFLARYLPGIVPNAFGSVSMRQRILPDFRRSQRQLFERLEDECDWDRVWRPDIFLKLIENKF